MKMSSYAIILGLVAVALLVFVLRQQGEVKLEGHQKVSPEVARALMAASGSYTLLDVRTPEEYAETRIPGAKLLPLSELEARAERELPDKEAPVFVYCRSGRRSAAAGKLLEKLGYKKVYDIGGILSWPYEKE